MAKRLTWKARIAAAKKRGAFQVADYRDACSWKSCAVSEYEVPRAQLALDSKMPEDETLRNLGADFMRAVNCDDAVFAARLRRQIEKRAKEVKRAAQA